MVPNYLADLAIVDKICYEFREQVRKNFFMDYNGSYAEYSSKSHWPHLPIARKYIAKISRLVEICDLFGIRELESIKNDLQKNVHILEEERDETRNWKSFESLIQNIVKPFTACRTELNRLEYLLEEKERVRLNEAIHVYMESAYYSSVAMSVSAIEYRLLMLMKMANPDQEVKLEKMTFGALIDEYLHEKSDQYKDLLPAKHKPLLELCNTYRIFSVHPKQEEIDRKVATSILNLTLLFLLDEKIKEKINLTKNKS